MGHAENSQSSQNSEHAEHVQNSQNSENAEHVQNFKNAENSEHVQNSQNAEHVQYVQNSEHSEHAHFFWGEHIFLMEGRGGNESCYRAGGIENLTLKAKFKYVFFVGLLRFFQGKKTLFHTLH